MLLAPTRPDWRWARACALHKLPLEKALARLQQMPDDDNRNRIGRLLDFKRKLRRTEPTDDPETPMEAAYALSVLESQFRQKTEIDAWLLTGASNEEICLQTAMDSENEEVIQLYHDAFFDVRARRERPSWVVSSVFATDPHLGLHKMDPYSRCTRIAWMAGAEGWALYRKRMALTPPERVAIEQLMLSNLARCGLDMSMRGGIDREEAGAIIAIMTYGKQTQAGANIGDDLTEAIRSFLGELGSTATLADVSNERKVALPAREPRVLDYMSKTPELVRIS